MNQEKMDWERKLLREALTPPDIAGDLSGMVMDRIERSNRRRTGILASSRRVWLTAASLLLTVMAGMWFAYRHSTVPETDPGNGQVLVESVRVLQNDALIVEFAGQGGGDTKYFWFEAQPLGGSDSGEES